ncbi:hypothetical protein ACTXN8_21290 [Pseudomonas helleri]|uniref:hypothetical protein n=1 Tax=Pseudomonas helleri TaxID=1608996 RepID=UPI000654287B|nr:hypothetical protein [Pseudomonas helleri]KMN24318.1 hypothetical protein TU85_04645 [Pseudomonas helleri]
MSLGNSFPAFFTQAQIARQLKAGIVIKLNTEMDDGQILEKRFVVLDVTDDTLTCVMNSKISNFIANRPAKLKCQVMIDVASHDFMDHDSHIDCSRVRPYPTSLVIDQLCKNPAWVLGQITEQLRDDICAGLKASTTTATAVTNKCCSSLEQADL